MWADEAERLALLELVATGSLRRRAGQRAALDELSRLGWVRRASRSDTVVLDARHRASVEGLLDRVWPEGRETLARLSARGLSPDPDGWRLLQDQDRRDALDLAQLPTVLNQHTAAALLGPHAKVGLTDARREALVGRRLTTDDGVRLRPSAGLALTRGEAQLELDTMRQALGEVLLPERALLAGLRLAGRLPDALLLVENLGAYVDLPEIPGWAMAHAPGWNTSAVRLLLAAAPAVPVVLFGDIDPANAEIAAHLRGCLPGLRWFAPSFAGELLDLRKPRHWPAHLDLERAPAAVRQAAREGWWMEQEGLVLDGRLIIELDNLL